MFCKNKIYSAETEFNCFIFSFNVVEHTDNILEVALKAIENIQLVSQTPGYHR